MNGVRRYVVYIKAICFISSFSFLHIYGDFAIKNTLDRPVFIRTSNTAIKQQHEFQSNWQELSAQEIFKTDDTITYLTISESQYPRYAEAVQHFKLKPHEHAYVTIKEKNGKPYLIPDELKEDTIPIKDIQYIPEIDMAFKSELLDAIARQNLADVDKILREQKEHILDEMVHTEFAYGWTPLHLAVFAGYIRGSSEDISIVEQLIQAGANVHSETRSGLTPDDLLKDNHILNEKHIHSRNTEYIQNIFNQFEQEHILALSIDQIHFGVVSAENYKEENTYEVSGRQEILFELLNSTHSNIYVHIGTFEAWNALGAKWQEIKPGDRIYSHDPITQLVYSTKENPQYIEDVQYYVFNKNMHQKVLIRVIQQGNKVVLKEQEPVLFAMSKKFSVSPAIKMARAMRAPKGAVSKTGSGISFASSIDEKDIMWLPYFYLPWRNAELNQIRNLMLHIMHAESTENAKELVQRFIDEYIDTWPYTYMFYNGWTFLHETALWVRTADVFELLYEALLPKFALVKQAHKNLADITGQTPKMIKESVLVSRAVSSYIESPQFMGKLPQLHDVLSLKEVREWDEVVTYTLNELKDIFGPEHAFSNAVEYVIKSYAAYNPNIDTIAIRKLQLYEMKNLREILLQLKQKDQDGMFIEQLIDNAPKLNWSVDNLFQQALQLDPLTTDNIYDFIRKKVETSNEWLAQFKAYIEKSIQEKKGREIKKVLPEGEKQKLGKISIPEEQGLPIGMKEIIERKQQEQEEWEIHKEDRVLQEGLELLAVKEEIPEFEEKAYFSESFEQDEVYNQSEIPIYVVFESERGIPFDLRRAQLVTIKQKGFIRKKVQETQENILPHLKKDIIVELQSGQAVKVPHERVSQICISNVSPEKIEDVEDVITIVSTNLKKPLRVQYHWKFEKDEVTIHFNQNPRFLQEHEVLFPPYGAIGKPVFGNLTTSDIALKYLIENPEYFRLFLANELAMQKEIFDAYAQKNGVKALAYALWFRNVDAVTYLINNNFARGSDTYPLKNAARETLAQFAQKLQYTLTYLLPYIISDTDKHKLNEIVELLKKE